MNEIDYSKLTKNVEKTTKKNYQARYQNGHLVPNVANLGGKIGDIVKVERSGEYSGLAVQLMEDIKPLLTDRIILKILTMYKKEDYMTPLNILGLSTMEQLQYVLHQWFTLATLNYDNSFKQKKKFPMLDQWIKTMAHDPLLGKIKVVEIGQNQNTGGSVVPPEWIDKTFDNGQQMQEEMSKLETRIGKPPVTYAVIYSMIIQKNDKMLSDIKNVDYDTVFYIELVGSNLKSSLSTKIRKGYQYVKYNNTLIGFVLDDILEPKGKIKDEHQQSKIREVGLLVSRLQKSIRRGRYGSKALIETIDTLNISPNYNLPEHGFLRVSASKQLAWRLFISIIEDCRPYQAINEPELLDLLLLALITQRVQEYRFTKPVLNAIKLLAVIAQFNDTHDDLYDWRVLPIADDTPLSKTSNFHNALSLAISNIMMMAGDNRMLRKYYSLDNECFEPFMYPPNLRTVEQQNALPSKKFLYHSPAVYEDIILSSYDPHCKTSIILYYQACIPVSLTTKQISGYIWDKSSSFNVRSLKPRPPIDKLLRSVQLYFLSGTIDKKQNKCIIQTTKELVMTKPNEHAKRTSFLVLFGKKYRFAKKEIVLSGTEKEPIRIKNNNEWIYSDDQSLLNSYPERIINLTDIDPPFGYKWTESKVTTKIVDGKPRINNNIVPLFDGSNILESIVPIIDKSIDSSTYDIIIDLLAGFEIDFDTILNFRLGQLSKIVNWSPSNKHIKKINFELVKLVYTKLFNQFNNIVAIGPVSRSGQRMHNSINYLMEGKLWAIFNLFSYLYPSTIKLNGSLNFIIKKDTPGYVHLIRTLESILFTKEIITGPLPIIKTKLWDHQIDSVNKIIYGFRHGRFGCGDASSVGSGKTLKSLVVGRQLMESNNTIYSGILVLLPGNNLIKTWDDELKNHTEGFDVIFQKNNSDVGPINRNTIVISTMGRNRDHPINHKWLLIIIDECLTVQNKNALWTESAWAQSMMTKHLIMMSATFFRARFDKLYYMLKMLRTGLPEKSEYLDVILLESIVSQMAITNRKWTSNINYFELDPTTRTQYDVINRSDLSLELKFAKLNSLLVSSAKTNNFIIDQLRTLIKKLEKKNHRCLIYARANEEAQLWSKQLNIPIYPKKQNHCIVTYHDGTYGLNDLIIYDTIIMRPPQPDKLPQIKGRLDRFPQKSMNLHIEYFVLNNTIEMGLLLRMELASKFMHQYIMPLAKFYDVSINYKKYLEEKD
jgi:hypothetical protein